MASHKNYARRRAAGLCPLCGADRKPEERQHVLCQPCRTKNQERKLAYIRMGRCRHCGQRLDRKGSQCLKCLERHKRANATRP